MTKRRLAALSLSFTAAVFLLNERTAFSSALIDELLRPATADDQKSGPILPRPAMPAATPAAAATPPTIWELLRDGDPLHKRVGIPTSIQQAVRNAQPDIDPETGKPKMVAVAKPRKKHTGMLGFFDSMHDTFATVGKKLHSDIKIRGNQSIGFHNEAVSGSGQTYQADNYFGQRGLGGGYNQTDLTISGKVLGIFNFETHYNNNPYGNPYENRLSLNYASKHFKLDAGDITGSITGNSLIDFSRTLKGIEVAADVLKGVKVTTLMSQTKASPRTVVLNGTNGPGPYYVYAGQIVDGSVHVRVNNKDMVLGKDFTLDLYTGQLQFTAGTIINPQDVIAVTFETYGYGQQPGTIFGLRTDLRLFKGSKMGVTMLTENSGSKSSAPQSRTEKFYGQDSTQPYVLMFPVDLIILKRDSNGLVTDAQPRYPMTVTVNGQPQVYGVQYLVNPNLPNQVFFKQSFPAASQIPIDITYTPVSTNEAPGNRKVMGVDALLPVGHVGNIVAEYANSGYDLSSNKISGSAMQVRGDFRFLKDRLHTSFNLRNISPSFTSIESVGFNQNDKGLTLASDWLITKGLKLTATMEHSKRPSYDYSSLINTGTSGFGTAVGADDFSSINLGLNWQLGRAGQLNFAHTGMNTNLAAGGTTKYNTDSLGFAYNFKSLGVDLQLSKNSNYSSSLSNTTGTTTTTTTTTPFTSLSAYSGDSLSERMGLKWRASDWLSFTGVVANSKVNNTSGQNNDAKNMQLNAEVKPLRSMTLRFGYQLSDSGGYSIYGNNTTGTTTGTTPTGTTGSTTAKSIFGFPAYLTRQTGSIYTPPTSITGVGAYTGGGYNSNLGGFGNYSGGFYTPGLSSGFTATGFAGKSRTINASMDYQPFRRLNLNFTWNQATSQGDYSFNSSSNNLGLNLSYTLGERLAVSSSFTTQHIAYIGTTGGTTSNMMFFNVRGRPFGRLTTTLSYQIMRSNSSGANTTTTTPTTVTTNPLLNGVLPVGTGTTGTNTGIIDPTTGLPAGYGTLTGYGATNLDSYSIRLEYPLFRGNNLFFQFDNAGSTGYLASLQRTLAFGINFAMTQNMGFTLGWRDQMHIDQSGTTTGSYNYHVRSLDADINMHF